MLVSRARERDLVGNRVPEEMSAAQGRLEELSAKTVKEAVRWLGVTGETGETGPGGVRPATGIMTAHTML